MQIVAKTRTDNKKGRTTMKAFYVTVWDMFMLGGKINLVVDTDEVSGLIMGYNGDVDFETLQKNIQPGQRILVGTRSEKHA